MKNKYFLLASICCAITSNAFAESLEEVYSLSRQNDYQLKAAIAAYSAGQETVNIARAAFLPQISARGTWSKSDSTTKIESSNPFAPTTSAIVKGNGPSYSVSLSQSLIDFSALHNLSRGKIAGKIAALQFESAEQSNILRTADLYLQTITAGAKLLAAQSAEESFRVQLNSAKLKYDVGMARLSNFLEAQAALDAAVADTLVAKNNLSILFDSLRTLTGQDQNELLAFPDNFVALPPYPSNPDDWVAAAEKSNLDSHIAQLKLEDAQKNFSQKKAEHLPKLSAGLSYSDGYTNQSFNTALPNKTIQHGLTATITVNIPIYSGGATSATAKEASYRYIEQQENSEGIAKDIKQKAHSQYLSVLSGVSAINARKAAIISSQKALETSQKGYEEGVIDIINVLEAQKNAYLAKQNYADALYNFAMSTLRLKEVTGALSASDIIDLSKQLDPNKKVKRPTVN